MNNKINILIAGGDMRQIYCAERLAEKYSTSAAGFDSDILPADMRASAAPLPEPKSCDIAVLPVRALGSDGNISTPFCGEALSAAEVARAVRDGGTVFIGVKDRRLDDLFPRQKLISYLDRDELLLKNASLTAEGAVQLALERLDTALNSLPVLIVGLGRIGTALALILRGFGADITAAVRSPKAKAKAEMLGIKSIPTDRLGGGHALVFNTAPAALFTAEAVGRFPDDTLFIELASDSAGFDDDAADMLGERLIRAGGLPSKTAPVTAGRIIADAVDALITEGGIGNEN